MTSAPASSPAESAAKLFDRIRDLVVAARQTVARGVDLVQVHTCYRIGMYMVEHEQQGRARADYGKALLDDLAARLSAEFGRGFSRSSLAAMRSFYQAYPGRMPIVQTASGQSPQPFSLSWSHYVFLLGIKNPDERSFYEIEATQQARRRRHSPHALRLCTQWFTIQLQGLPPIAWSTSWKPSPSASASSVPVWPSSSTTASPSP